MFDIAMRTIFVWYNNFLPLKYSLKKYFSWVSWIPDKIEKLFRLSWKFIWRISSIRHKLHLDCKIFDVRCAFWSYAPFNPNGPFTPNLDPLFLQSMYFWTFCLKSTSSKSMTTKNHFFGWLTIEQIIFFMCEFLK